MAAAWLAQRDEGLTAEEAADFERWQQADPQHAAAVARLERTWSALQQLREFRPESRVHPDPDLLAGARPAARIISFPTAALAGLAAAVAIAAFVWWPRSANPAPAVAPDQPVYATTAGGYQRVTLDDGSVLELNADSLVRVIYTPAERRVQLERGEGHFTVAKNPQRPFFVVAGNVAVRAVGTAFSVRLAGDEVEVLVTEGRVRVENQAAGAVTPAAASELGVGQRLVLSTLSGVGSGPVQPENLAPEAVQQALAWQGSRLRFVDTPLASVVAQFNRHNRVQIELADESLASVPVDGSLRADNVEALIHLLEADPSIAVERVGSDRIVLRRVR
jgi:transmembrane sensor